MHSQGDGGLDGGDETKSAWIPTQLTQTASGVARCQGSFVRKPLLNQTAQPLAGLTPIRRDGGDRVSATRDHPEETRELRDPVLVRVTARGGV